MRGKGGALGRPLRLLDAVGIGLGAIIGAGIFVVTGVAAAVAGPALLVGLLLAGIAAAANALSSAQLAAAIPQSGATYEYGYRLVHPWAGFAAGWMFLASKISAAGTVAIGLAGYLEPLTGASPKALAVASVIAFTVLASLGVQRTSRVNLLIVAVSFGSLLTFVAVGAPHVDRSQFTPFAPGGLAGTLEAAAILFFAYTGYARIATLGEEVAEPQRTIPRAIVITVASAFLLYAAVAFVAVGTVGTVALADDAAPLRVAAGATGQQWLPTVLSAGGIFAMLGVILSQLLGLSRMTLAMARRGDLPRWLSAIHAGRNVPVRATVVVGSVAAVVAAAGTLSGTARVAAFTILIYYGIANIAALRLPARERLFPRWIPGTGLAGCVLLAFALDLRATLTGGLVLAFGFLLRALWRTVATRG
jgi:basic amino acid/polyamine antiporter, APA family